MELKVFQSSCVPKKHPERNSAAALVCFFTTELYSNVYSVPKKFGNPTLQVNALLSISSNRL